MPEQTLEQLLIANDLAKLSIEQRVAYYNDVCKSLGLNPLTRPFDFITLNSKLQLYAKKDATDQLRRIYSVSVNELTHDHKESLGLYIVTARGTNGQGREDASTGAVSIKGLAGDALANAIMKAETKAKRRLTLSLCGLGILDETEIETAQPERVATIVDGQVVIDPETQKSLAERPPVTEKPKRGRKPKESVSDAGKPWGGQFEQKALENTPESALPENVKPAVQKTDKRADFPFGENAAIVNKKDSTGVPYSIVESLPATNIHGLDIKDEEIPFPGDPEPTPVTNRLATDEERTGFQKRLVALRDKGYDGPALRQYLMKNSGVAKIASSNEISFLKFTELVARLEQEEKNGTLKALLEAK